MASLSLEGALFCPFWKRLSGPYFAVRYALSASVSLYLKSVSYFAAASPSFREVFVSRLGPWLPASQLAWLTLDANNTEPVPSSGASSPLFKWISVSAQLVECLSSLCTGDHSEIASVVDAACTSSSTAALSKDLNHNRSGGGISRQGSVRDGAAMVNGGDEASLCLPG